MTESVYISAMSYCSLFLPLYCCYLIALILTPKHRHCRLGMVGYLVLLQNMIKTSRISSSWWLCIIRIVVNILSEWPEKVWQHTNLLNYCDLPESGACIFPVTMAVGSACPMTITDIASFSHCCQDNILKVFQISCWKKPKTKRFSAVEPIQRIEKLQSVSYYFNSTYVL